MKNIVISEKHIIMLHLFKNSNASQRILHVHIKTIILRDTRTATSLNYYC